MAIPRPNIVVQSDVPPPPPHVRGRPAPVYPFSEMAVNSSFFIAGGNANTVHSAVRRFVTTKGEGCKFTLRKVSEVVAGEEDKGEQEGVRVWRTE